MTVHDKIRRLSLEILLVRDAAARRIERLPLRAIETSARAERYINFLQAEIDRLTQASAGSATSAGGAGAVPDEGAVIP